jgi:hypothetical protein
MKDYRFTVRLSKEMYEELEYFCKKNRNISKGKVTEASLKKFLQRNTDDDLILRRLERVTRTLERQDRDNDILMEAFSAFVKIWMAHTPRIPDEHREAAKSSAAARYHDFVNHVSRQVSLGHRFVDDLVQDVPADDSELKAVLEKVEA